MGRASTLTESDIERARVLRAEGVPMSWIAEDLDCRRMTLSRAGISEDPEATAEWRSAWSKIRRSDQLYALHAEFAPPRRYST
jgi:hypothetical protein